MSLQFHGRHFEWTFLLAEVHQPILGADFLKFFKLVVDMDAGQLLDLATMQRFGPAACSSSSGLLANIQATPKAFRDLFTEFQDVANPSGRLPDVKHGVEHVLETTGRPVTAKFRRLDQDKLKAAKDEFLKMEREGIIRRSRSSWASPLHMVKKTDGTWRPCGDYRQLNLATVADKYPVPNMQDLSGRLHGCRVFSKLDLRKGYYQIPMRPADIGKTAIITPFGLWEFTRMPFGLKNAGQTFQRLMDRLGADLDFVFIYLDDILVASRDEKTHREHLHLVLERLREFGLVLNLEKCELGRETVEFLGHKISSSGVQPILKHVAAVQQCGRPVDRKTLQSFLGLVNFYRRFIPGAAGLLKPLTDALQGKSNKLEWFPAMETAFQAAKQAVCSATCLAHPDPEAEINLSVDASNTHTGAVLQQMTASGWQPLSFFSSKLSPAESRYSAFDRELLAAYLAVRHFRFMLEARKFHILTDHKPLTYALHRVSEPWSAKQQRQLSYLAEFTADIRHVAGKENVVADALSRPVESSSSSGGRPVLGGNVPLPTPHQQTETSSSSVERPPEGRLDLKRLAAAQQSCQQTKEAAAISSLQVATFNLEGADLLCDLSSGAVRPLIPKENRRSIFQQIHGIAHAGIRATRRMIAARFVWPGMASDIRDWVRDCQNCARAKVNKHVRASIQPIPVPERRFAHVHVDLVGPFPVSTEGYTHIFTMVDRTTRWAEAIPVPGTTTRHCAEAFFRGWVSRFGVPEMLTSDRGGQFTSEIWAALCQRLGIKHLLTTAYHPQANGLVERFHRQLKDAFRARLAGVNWAEHLPWVLLGLRAAPKEDSGVSSAEMLYGTPLTLPGELAGASEATATEIVDRIRAGEEFLPSLPTRLPAVTSPMLVPEALKGVSHVYVLRGGVLPPLAPRYQGPYLVVQKEAKRFLLAVGAQQEWVSVDRLKPHAGEAPVEAAQPPRRGRPPQPGSGSVVASLGVSWAEVVKRAVDSPQHRSPSTSGFGTGGAL
jgi:hypothetical protein